MIAVPGGDIRIVEVLAEIDSWRRFDEVRRFLVCRSDVTVVGLAVCRLVVFCLAMTDSLNHWHGLDGDPLTVNRHG